MYGLSLRLTAMAGRQGKHEGSQRKGIVIGFTELFQNTQYECNSSPPPVVEFVETQGTSYALRALAVKKGGRRSRTGWLDNYGEGIST